ncbi:hypothetical protein [Marinoscillum furvescens]|uniref:DUF4412 domain-containing protein n=1 Tax=Marinoscillum furvescens DSM 4134 TaxID=1122208 RepID=A0A3D9L160_MARFU|nr:hypothetical protein [Marinoscillum furvescens]RED97473.1 hypothetical protein C7460_11283 [Marinoscillum furvescens DSM 4134]
MRRHLLIFFLLFSSSVLNAQTGNSTSLNEKLPARFPLEEAEITYTIINGAEGSVRLIFDRNGWRSYETKEIVFKRYGVSSSEMRSTLTDGNMMYSINHLDSSGTKSSDYTWSQLLGYKNLEQTSKAIYNQQGGQLTGLDTLLGKPCNVWVFEKGSVAELWEWNALPLKVVKRVPGITYEMVAEEMRTQPTISEDDFSLPDYVNWK